VPDCCSWYGLKHFDWKPKHGRCFSHNFDPSRQPNCIQFRVARPQPQNQTAHFLICGTLMSNHCDRRCSTDTECIV
jgi:hypothetical protein